MRWWTPVEADEPPRAYCHRKVGKADLAAWGRRLDWGRSLPLHYITEPVDGLLTAEQYLHSNHTAPRASCRLCERGERKAGRPTPRKEPER